MPCQDSARLHQMWLWLQNFYTAVRFTKLLFRIIFTHCTMLPFILYYVVCFHLQIACRNVRKDINKFLIITFHKVNCVHLNKELDLQEVQSLQLLYCVSMLLLTSTCKSAPGQYKGHSYNITFGPVWVYFLGSLLT